MTERIITCSSIQYFNYTGLAFPSSARNTLPEDTHIRGKMKPVTRRDLAGVFEISKNINGNVKYGGL